MISTDKHSNLLWLTPGIGGAHNKVSYSREALPRDATPYPFIYHFWEKRYPFHILSIDKFSYTL